MSVREIKFSQKTTGKVGYPDAHAEVAVSLPWPLGTHTLRIEANELDAAYEFIRAAIEHRNALVRPRQRR